MKMLRGLFEATSYTFGYCVLLILCSLALGKACSADLLRVDELSIDYKNYAILNDKARNLLIYPEHPKEGINLNLNLSLVEVCYWNSTIESLTTSAKYQGIGLETRLGVRLSEGFDFGVWHHSQHTLDRSPNIDKFPSEDALELKLYLIGGKNRNTLF